MYVSQLDSPNVSAPSDNFSGLVPRNSYVPLRMVVGNLCYVALSRIVTMLER